MKPNSLKLYAVVSKEDDPGTLTCLHPCPIAHKRIGMAEFSHAYAWAQENPDIGMRRLMNQLQLNSQNNSRPLWHQRSRVHARARTNSWSCTVIFCAKETKFEREAEIVSRCMLVTKES